MILVRNVMQVKWGHANEVVEGMKKDMMSAAGAMPGGKARLMTDLTGQFFTVVLESEHESLAAWEQFRAMIFSRPEYNEGFAQIGDLIESGRSEIFTIEGEFGS